MLPCIYSIQRGNKKMKNISIIEIKVLKETTENKLIE